MKLVETAKEEKVEMVVLGTKGRSNIAGILFGSQAEKSFVIVQCHCSASANETDSAIARIGTVRAPTKSTSISPNSAPKSCYNILWRIELCPMIVSWH